MTKKSELKKQHDFSKDNKKPISKWDSKNVEAMKKISRGLAKQREIGRA